MNMTNTLDTELLEPPPGAAIASALRGLFHAGDDARRSYIVEGWRQPGGVDAATHRDAVVGAWCATHRRPLPREEDYVLLLGIHPTREAAEAAWGLRDGVEPAQPKKRQPRKSKAEAPA